MINRVPHQPNADRAKYADAWQLKMTTVYERNRYILDNELFTDCSFLVGRLPAQKTFKCVKAILVGVSAVFEGLLFGENAATAFPIAIPDVHPDAFQAMLDYAYCDEVNLKDREQAEAVMYICKKYNLRFLMAKCQKYLCASSNRTAVRAM